MSAWSDVKMSKTTQVDTKSGKKAMPVRKNKQIDALSMKLADPLKSRLQLAIINAKSNPHKVSKAIGLNPTSIRALLTTSRQPLAETVVKLSEHLGVSVQWLMTGQSIPGVDSASSAAASNSPAEEMQVVPVIDFDDVMKFISKEGDYDVLREEMAPTIEPAAGRFRLTHKGRSMTPEIHDGAILDCSSKLVAEPEDVVLVWLAKSKRVEVRRIQPESYADDGTIQIATLSASKGWPDLRFSAADGDKVVAVVHEVIRQLRPVRRLTAARKRAK
jgi:plasmid maintenance system antidote protein VapI